MEKYKPVTLEVNGQEMSFEQGKTEVHLYRNVVDGVYNHIQAEMYGTQRAYLFNAARHIIYLSGIIVPNSGLKGKEAAKLADSMEMEFGWNARVIIDDEAPETIKERYIRTVSRDLEKCVSFPAGWL